MAFKSNVVKSNDRNTTNNANASWKASGFLNLFLPSSKGNKYKLGTSGIPLRESKENEKAIFDWLKEDPSRVSVIKAKLIVKYQPVNSLEANAYAGIPAHMLTEDTNETDIQGYLNFYLPLTDGTTRQLGFVPLHNNVNSEHVMADWLEDDEANVSKIAKDLIIEFQTTSGNKVARFDLG